MSHPAISSGVAARPRFGPSAARAGEIATTRAMPSRLPRPGYAYTFFTSPFGATLQAWMAL